MEPRVKDNTVTAYCPGCKAVALFSHQAGYTIEQATRVDDSLRSLTGIRGYGLHQCSGCMRGALSTIFIKQGDPKTAQVLEDFYPFSVEAVDVPSAVPADIRFELREAEQCMAIKAFRAASALLRSVLEKTLKANGYTTGSLKGKIEAAAEDQVITASRRIRAQQNIRVLGNDILHDEYRLVAANEVEDSHRYCQRILEDFYDHRESTQKILIEKGRLTDDPGESKSAGDNT